MISKGVSQNRLGVSVADNPAQKMGKKMELDELEKEKLHASQQELKKVLSINLVVPIVPVRWNPIIARGKRLQKTGEARNKELATAVSLQLTIRECRWLVKILRRHKDRPDSMSDSAVRETIIKLLERKIWMKPSS